MGVVDKAELSDEVDNVAGIHEAEWLMTKRQPLGIRCDCDEGQSPSAKCGCGEGQPPSVEYVCLAAQPPSVECSCGRRSQRGGVIQKDSTWRSEFADS